MRVRRFKDLTRQLEYLKPEQVEKIQQAYDLAEKAHHHQKRRSGEPYITHPLAVAVDLASMRMDAETVMAALLHDVIEDTEVTKQEIAEQFGDTVADLVDGVSKLTQVVFKSRREAQAENFRKMLLAMSKDIRVIIVKLADRLHNMRTLGVMPPEKKRRIARETLEIFAPIAHRLGMHDIATELETLGFEALHPNRYRVLKSKIKRVRGDQKRVLANIKKNLEKKLKERHIENYEVLGREKNLYSIYKKMLKKKLPLKQIMDVYGFRIVTQDVDSCYRVLGVAHSAYTPILERFKDYIAIPKANGYQSLHTTLFGPEGVPIEIQIRTTEMEQMAASGIAAHWRYKMGEAPSSEAQARAEDWLKNLLEMQQKTGNSLEFIEDVKIDLFPDEVYVFTPQGEIIKLPSQATPIDFAYMVHTDIGNSCVAAKIDRQLAPLSSRLSSGQTVEIITAKQARPNPVWLDFVITAKAKSAIRHYLKTQRRGEAAGLGRRLLDQALHDYASSLRRLSQKDLLATTVELGYQDVDDLMADIGLGNRAALVVAHQIMQHTASDQQPLQKSANGPLLIQGTEGMVVHFSDCCYPLPGDPIIGLIDKGKGIEIHLANCPERMRRMAHKPKVDVSWAKNVTGDFLALVDIHALNKTGVFAKVAQVVADYDADISDIRMAQPDVDHFIATLKLKVNTRQHLANIIRRLRQLNVVTKVVHKRAES